MTGWWQGGKGGVTLSLTQGRCYEAWHQVLSVVRVVLTPAHPSVSLKALPRTSVLRCGVCYNEGLLVAWGTGEELRGSGVCIPQVGATTLILACTGLHKLGAWFPLVLQLAQEGCVSLVLSRTNEEFSS